MTFKSEDLLTSTLTCWCVIVRVNEVGKHNVSWKEKKKGIFISVNCKTEDSPANQEPVEKRIRYTSSDIKQIQTHTHTHHRK